ncbi:MAG: hypothetical protein IPJ77_04150 [Planctomycetes bacterium]|nr:hypothetical protein [Planctomycetota bacterium]
MKTALLSIRSLFAAAGALALAATASAQTCTFVTGPDVIVGECTGPQNYTSTGGLDAIAVGTTSCNVGNVVLNWVSSSVNHPVIGGGVFKYKQVNGAWRFEQLGQSWLKHAFVALQGTTCCSNCTPNPGGVSGLGIGCSDPYTASRNGTQSGLGPKYQVNANTGAYIAAPPHPSGGNNGRCQMDVTRLEPSSANVRYFMEAQYVTLDDSQWNNNDNNTSYRELSCTGGPTEFSFATAGSTQRRKAGIEAWKVIDPTVNQLTISVPESSAAPYDGNAKLILSWQVTNLGGGQWHYEYALYNMNSDRSIRAFSLPIPAGVTVSNIGFNDVAYLGNDGNGNVNFDGTDWTGTVSGGALTWSTQTLAQNNNANALRWGTTYNFRFDANTAPQQVNLTLSQYKIVNDVVVAGVDAPSAGQPAVTAYCAGDGVLTDCPCANNGGTGRGCANSSFANGALLSATGTASVSGDTLVLNASSMTGATCVFFLGDAQMLPVIVDDGLGCVTGSVVRLGTKAVGGNNSSFPQPGDPTISVRASIPGAGGTRFVQCFYRNAVASFCPPATSNRTNGLQITYVP